MMKIINCEQGSPEWFQARLGIPTASEFKTIIGVKKDAREKVTRATYMRKLVGEILTGEPAESYTNEHMERGKALEDEARNLYCTMHDAEPQRVGFIRNGDAGCSPDSLIGADGGLEIKTALAHIQVDRLLRNELPPEHKAQVQGNLLISNREWWDFASYTPRLPLFVIRVYRDNGYLANLIGAINEFNDEVKAMVEQMRRYGAEPARLDEPANILLAG